ncbi:hypothetical protein MIC97_16100 [Aquamicrobium sp. NLF2-7]|jgi:hypothetical protein|uniref:Uncharacterized protein n=1 Tax=Aquamicrobium lusatiense TaxID=89772 RepID=A0A7W9VVM1_9HYPH|nr:MULTISPECIES: hypothetical protein [Aquamicrobium]MBB6012197.1 hypothetical protein [Aquamicrobium lusatiense]MCG8273021.1 hypothetical protein [Aquamicrobium sp. NLF2-7]
MTVKAFFCGLAGLVAATAQGAAETRIDSRIDDAAREIVAARMGELRGSFAPGQQPVLVRQQAEQRQREPLRVLQYGRYRDNPRPEPQSRKTR